jgi:hypothetical protein
MPFSGLRACISKHPESDPMTTPDQAISETIAGLSHADAEMLLDVIVGASAGLVDAVAPVHSLADAELYGVMIASVPKMIAAQGGPEASQIILAAAITRLVRQKMEATT